MSASPPDAAPRRSRAAAGAALVTFLALLATVDTRAFGLIPDGREMLSVAAAVSRFFEIGISRDFANAPRRPAGDAVSRYGMGLSLVEAVPAAVARATGTARSASIFVLVPLLALAGCAWACARALARWGAPAVVCGVFGVALVFATPLWGYAASDYGEPLQAFLVALSVLALVELREQPLSRRWQLALGLAAGFAVLTKTLLVLVVLPLIAAAVFSRRVASEEDGDFLEGKRGGDGASSARAASAPSGRKMSRAQRRSAQRRQGLSTPAPGFTPPWPLVLSFMGILLLWVLFEIARFGKLGGGYAGETFTYPFFTGLLRLTLLPNKGLLWYAPVVVFAVPGFLALRRKDRRLALALGVSSLALLLASSAWWAWDGQAGWGPRLLLPGLPPALLLAGRAFSRGGAGLRIATLLALVFGVAVNALGALVPFAAVYALSSQVEPQPMPEGRAAGTPYEVGRRPDGVFVASAPHHLSLTPAWSPIRVHALVFVARARAAWDGALPALDPPFHPEKAPSPAPALRLALSPPRFGWGRDLVEKPADTAGRGDPYFDALRDQLVRAIDMRDIVRARGIGEEIERREERISANDPRTVALVAEVIRLGGAAASLSYLSKKSSSSSFSCHPWILFVRAMAEPPGDFSCLPEAQREGFAQGVALARRSGWTLTDWNRAATAGRP